MNKWNTKKNVTHDEKKFYMKKKIMKKSSEQETINTQTSEE